MRSIQSRRLEDRRLEEFPADRDEGLADASGRELRLRRSLGRYHGKTPSAQGRRPLPRNIDPDIRRSNCAAEELEVRE